MVGDEIFYWYEAGYPLRIALARSRDGKNWTRQGEPVVPLGPRGSFDERAVADPYVIRAGDRFYMFYLGQDRARRQSLGIARSSDGVTWEKLRTNPILEPGAPGAFDENGLGEPAVWTSGGQWWMLYTGRDKSEQRRLGLARSADGVRWERVPNFVVSGTNAWDSQVMCDPERGADARWLDSCLVRRRRRGEARSRSSRPDRRWRAARADFDPITVQPA